MKWLTSAIVAISLTASTFAAVETRSKKNKLSENPAPTELLEKTSETFAQVAETTMPATVSIKGIVTQPQQQYLNPFDMFGDDFFRRFFGGGGNPFQNQPQFEQQQPQQMTGGSGFLIAPEGLIVTNNHVIQNATQITVTLNDGREYPATVVGSDPRTDLAVIKIDEKNLPFLKFGDSEKVKIGNWVIAIGNPFGLEATLTVGVVSAKGRQDLGIAPYEDFIQTDAAINPGNSGGPLLNLQGEVIGVNTAIYSRSGGYMGIGLAIPSHMVQNVIDQIKEGGSVKRAFLGIVLQPFDKELADAIGAERQEGILVSEVIKDSPAAKAGLLQGDILVQLNEKPIKNVSRFRNEIGMMKPETPIQLRIIRNNKPMQISLKLGAQSEGEALTAEVMENLGIEMENLTADLANRFGIAAGEVGVVITKVKPGSPAAAAGLRPSYLITGVAVDWTNQKPIHNIVSFQEALKDLGGKKHIILIIKHQNFQRYYTLKLG